MKRLFFFIPVMMAGTMLFAQNDCSKNNPIYKDHGHSRAKVVRTLGADPEFPFLQNLSTREQVLAAMKNPANAKRHPRQMKELNSILKGIGFENGVKDVTLSNISPADLPKGTTGNMGDGKFGHAYTRLDGAKSYKGWKITSEHDCSIVFLRKCGNAFYPDNVMKETAYTGKVPECDNVPVNVSSEAKEITIKDMPENKIVKKTYIYYKKECGCFSCKADSYADDEDRSRPLLVKKEVVVERIPQTFRVTTSNTGTATVCNGKPSEVHTDINIERESAYGGYKKPVVKKEFIEVSKREYKRALKDKYRDWNP